MSLKTIFPTDANDRVIECAADIKHISGVVTDEVIFEGEGILFVINIFKDVDGGTFQLKDYGGNPITPAVITDYAGSFGFGAKGYWCRNGCKITTTAFTGGLISVYYVQ